MGAALNTAASMNGYVLADRGTWLSFKNRGDLEILVEGDRRLFNQYGIILVNPASTHMSRRTLAKHSSIGWWRPKARAIADYKINGQQLFPNATAGAS